MGIEGRFGTAKPQGGAADGLRQPECGFPIASVWWVCAMESDPPTLRVVGENTTGHTNPPARWQRVAGPPLAAALRGIDVTAPRGFRRCESLDYDHRRAAAWAMPSGWIVARA